MSKTITGRCDFCQLNEPKHTINGGLWWICAACFEETYGGPPSQRGRRLIEKYSGEEE